MTDRAYYEPGPWRCATCGARGVSAFHQCAAPASAIGAPADELAQLRGLRRCWRIELDAAGAPLVWTGRALTEAGAIARARTELDRDHAGAAAARVIACIEVAAPAPHPLDCAD